MTNVKNLIILQKDNEKNLPKANNNKKGEIMNDIEVFTIPTCPFCKKAKDLLNDNYLDYFEYDISHDETNMRNELGKRFNIKGEVTVPQIVINCKHIGGYTDLKEIVQNGKLHEYLR